MRQKPIAISHNGNAVVHINGMYSNFQCIYFIFIYWIFLKLRDNLTRVLNMEIQWMDFSSDLALHPYILNMSGIVIHVLIIPCNMDDWILYFKLNQPCLLMT